MSVETGKPQETDVKHCGAKSLCALKGTEIATIGELADDGKGRRVFLAADAVYEVDRDNNAVRIQQRPEEGSLRGRRVAFLAMDASFSLLVH